MNCVVIFVDVKLKKNRFPRIKALGDTWSIPVRQSRLLYPRRVVAQACPLCGQTAPFRARRGSASLGHILTYTQSLAPSLSRPPSLTSSPSLPLSLSLSLPPSFLLTLTHVSPHVGQPDLTSPCICMQWGRVGKPNVTT